MELCEGSCHELDVVCMYVLELAVSQGTMALMRRLVPIYQLLSEAGNYAAI